jgi:molybdate-binding protein
MIEPRDLSLRHDAARGELRLVGLTVKQYDFMIENGQLAEDTSTELLDALVHSNPRREAYPSPKILRAGDILAIGAGKKRVVEIAVSKLV